MLDLGPTFSVQVVGVKNGNWKCRSKKSSLSQEKDSEAEKMSNLIWKKGCGEKKYKLDCNMVYEDKEKHFQAETMMSLDTKTILKYHLVHNRSKDTIALCTRTRFLVLCVSFEELKIPNFC